MRLIVGLGNPGEKYEKTRHNIGFLICNEIAESFAANFRLNKDYEADIAEIDIDGEKVMLIEPQTFMNDSGRAISKIKNFYKVDVENIWVIHDEVDLENGKVRIQLGGSSAGHKGVQSIIDNIGEDLYRIRIGVGRDEKIPTDVWVLKNFTEEEKIEKIIDKVSNKMIEFIKEDIKEQTMFLRNTN